MFLHLKRLDKKEMEYLCWSVFRVWPHLACRRFLISSGLYQDENTGSGVITEVKYLELNQF